MSEAPKPDDYKAPSSSEEGVGGGGGSRLPTRHIMLARASAMRREPTEPEHVLWMALRHSRLDGYKFRRQAVIMGRIADFFCPTKGLVIEIDGETHERESDLRRDATLQNKTGFTTLRFTNGEVMRQSGDVLRTILLALEGSPDRWFLEERNHPPAPSSEEEGE